MQVQNPDRYEVELKPPSKPYFFSLCVICNKNKTFLQIKLKHLYFSYFTDISVFYRARMGKHLSY